MTGGVHMAQWTGAGVRIRIQIYTDAIEIRSQHINCEFNVLELEKYENNNNKITNTQYINHRFRMMKTIF